MSKKKFVGRLPYLEWPELLRKYAVVGVNVGGCVDGSALKSHRAHAHTCGTFEGWICFNASGVPTDWDLIAHELAHIISRQGHTKKFLFALRRIGADREALAMQRRFRWLQNY